MGVKISFLKFSLWFVLYLLIPFLIWGGLDFFQTGFTLIFLYFITSLHLAYYSNMTEDTPIQTTFWVFVYIFFVVAPAIQEIEGVYPWLDFYKESDIDFSYMLVLLGCLFFSIGAFSKFYVREYSYDFSSVKMRYFSILAPAVTTIAILAYGGFGTLFMAREEISAMFDGDIAIVSILQSLIRVPVFLISLYYMHLYFFNSEKIKTTKRNVFIIMVFLCVTTLLINNPISTPRFWVACVVLTYLFVYLKARSVKINRYLSLSLVFLILYVFPISDVFRRSTDVSIFDYAASQDLKDGLTYSANFDAFQQVINAVIYVDQNSYTFGHQMISALLFWIPRSIWSDKALSSGEMLAYSARYDYSNLSSPLWAEAFLDFGLVGVCCIFFIVGSISRNIDSSKNSVIAVLAVFLASYNVYFLRGSLMSVIGLLFVFLIFFYLVGVSKKNPVQRSSHE